MPRYPIGLTLTPQVRAELGLPPAHSSGRGSSILGTFELCVTLPDESECRVNYRRYGPASHRFQFDPPFKDIWLTERLVGDVPTVTSKANELAVQAFARAMADEQKQMRRKTLPPGAVKSRTEEQLKARTAELCAGRYAVCLRQASGRLSVVGPACPTPETPIGELLGGMFSNRRIVGTQRLVIGICNRALRCWVEARFLPMKRVDPDSDPEPDEQE